MMKKLILICAFAITLVLTGQSYAATPVALWLFDDGAGDVVMDSSGSGYNGNLRNDPTWGDGKHDGGLWFSAAAGSNVIAPLPHMDTLTITMWALYTNLASNNIGLIHVQAGADENADPGSKIIGIWVENSSTLWGRIIPDGVGNVNLPKNAQMEADVWNHVALVIDAAGGKATQYLNGEAIGEVDYSGALTPFTFLNIGRQGDESWEGGIDEVAVFDVALTKGEVVDIMNSNLSETAAVSPSGKVAALWGELKAR